MGTIDKCTLQCLGWGGIIYVNIYAKWLELSQEFCRSDMKVSKKKEVKEFLDHVFSLEPNLRRQLFGTLALNQKWERSLEREWDRKGRKEGVVVFSEYPWHARHSLGLPQVLLLFLIWINTYNECDMVQETEGRCTLCRATPSRGH